MGISDTTNRVVYSGDGSSTIFPFAHEFFAQTDLKVYLYDVGSSVSQAQALSTNYSISGSLNAQGIYPNGANVVFNSSVPITHQIVITRSPAKTNSFVLNTNESISSAALGQELDYLTTLVQRMEDQMRRAVRLGDGVGLQSNSSFNPVLTDTIQSPLLAGAPLIVNSGATGFDFGMVAIGDSGAVTYLGILPVSNGGTGVNTLPANQLIYGTGTSAVQAVAQGVPGYALFAMASSFPAFQQITASAINSGILAVANGGTGQSVYSDGQILIGNSNAATGLQAATLTAGSNVTIVNKGGSVAVHSASQPSLVMNNQTSRYVAAATDNVILMSGSSFEVVLYSPSGNTGKQITLVHQGSSFVQNYFISCSGNGTVAGYAGSSYVHFTNNEKSVLVADGGSNWVELNHHAETPWFNFGPIVISCSGAVKGATARDQFLGKRKGEDFYFSLDFQQNVAGLAGGATAYAVALPSVILMASSVLNNAQSINNVTGAMLGNGALSTLGTMATSAFNIGVKAFSQSSIYFAYSPLDASTGDGFIHRIVGGASAGSVNASATLASASTCFQAQGSFRAQGWLP